MKKEKKLENKIESKKLMTHIILNYPNEKIADLVVETLVKNGSDFVELQIPFSDPIADGSIISNAADKVLEQGFKVGTAFKKAKEYSKKFPNTKFIFVLYANTINSFGIRKFCENAKKSGVSGLIIPDLPFDSGEGSMTISSCKENNLDFIPVVSPNTPVVRLQKLWQALQPKTVYATAIAGITGTNVDKKDQNTFLKKYANSLRNVFVDANIAIGFGIKTAKDVRVIANYADVVVVGSAIVKLISDSYKTPNKLKLDLGGLVIGFGKEL